MSRVGRPSPAFVIALVDAALYAMVGAPGHPGLCRFGGYLDLG